MGAQYMKAKIMCLITYNHIYLTFISQKGHGSLETCLSLAKWDYVVPLHHDTIKNSIYSQEQHQAS